jgi:hypothetical protein
MTGGTLDLQLLAWIFCGGSWMAVILKLQRFFQPIVFVLKWVVCWTILSCKLGIECVLFFLSYSITLVVILITKKGTGGFFCFLIYCQHQGLLMKIISAKNSVFSSAVESLVDLEMTLCDGF